MAPASEEDQVDYGISEDEPEEPCTRNVGGVKAKVRGHAPVPSGRSCRTATDQITPSFTLGAGLTAHTQEGGETHLCGGTPGPRCRKEAGGPQWASSGTHTLSDPEALTADRQTAASG